MAHDIIAVGPDHLPISGTVLATAAHTATNTSDDIGLLGADDLLLVINFVKVGAAPSVTFALQGVAYPDGPAAPAVVWPILTSAAVVATGVAVLRVSDSMTPVANLVAQDIVPDKVRVVCTHSNGDSATYSITAIAAP